MQNMRFLIIDEAGTPINQGVILDVITPERYRCFFARKPSMQRIVTLDEIEGWNLFNTDEELGIFIAALAPLQMPVVPPEPEDPPPEWQFGDPKPLPPKQQIEKAQKKRKKKGTK